MKCNNILPILLFIYELEYLKAKLKQWCCFNFLPLNIVKCITFFYSTDPYTSEIIISKG